MEIKQTLRRGDAGEEVLEAKQRLFSLGFYEKAVTATRRPAFGADTERAVRRFQEKAGLPVDGVIGIMTWKAMFSGDDCTANAPTPSEKAISLVRLARERVGDLYIWGASGLEDLSDGSVQKRENAANAKRVLAFRDKQGKRGYRDLLGHDCSGFVSYLLREAGLWQGRRDCDGLWKMVSPLEKADLIEGDLVFRASGSASEDETHVGLYCGRGTVIHDKGRDAGVVLEGIDENGTGYWHKFGRIQILYKEDT